MKTTQREQVLTLRNLWMVIYDFLSADFADYRLQERKNEDETHEHRTTASG